MTKSGGWKQRSSNEICFPRTAEEPETVRAVEDGSRLPKFEFAYLKLLPREYEGPCHIVKVGQRPDGRCEYEERPGEAPPNQSQVNDENVMTIFFVRAQESGKENQAPAKAGGSLGFRAAPGIDADITS